MDRVVIKSNIRGKICTTMSNNLGSKQQLTLNKWIVNSGDAKNGASAQTSIKLALTSNSKIQINRKSTKILQENNGFLKISTQNDHKVHKYDDQLSRILNTELDEPLRLSLSPSSQSLSDCDDHIRNMNINNKNDNQISTKQCFQNSPSLKLKETTASNELSSLMGNSVDENMPPHKIITFNASPLLLSSSSSSSSSTTSSSYQEMATEISSKSQCRTPGNNVSGGIDSGMAGFNQQIKIIPTNNRLMDKPNYSPSAFSRMRAIQALRSPDKNKFFDVPSEEQDLVSDEERRLAANAKPKTIKDVMKDVVVYVEVRTGADNRSDGIKTVISQLGAKVNDRLLRNTTHVIFKGGLQSTYNKAKNWNIPIVSILWIEACRNSLRLVDPKKFVISDIEIYENPELHKKIRKQKSMQPNAEETRYHRKPAVAASGIASEITSKTHQTLSGSKINSSVGVASISNNNHIRIPRKPKDNLPEIFDTFAKNLLPKIGSSDNLIPNAEEPRLLQIIRESPYTTNKLIKSSKTALSNEENTPMSNTKRSLFGRDTLTDSLDMESDDCIVFPSSGDSPNSRNPETNAIMEKKTPQKLKKILSTPKKNSSRRHTTFTPDSLDDKKYQTPITNLNGDVSSINNNNMEITTPLNQQSLNSRYGTRSSTRRQTLYVSKSMDISDESILPSKTITSDTTSTELSILPNEIVTPIRRRRTMAFPEDKSRINENKTIEETPPADNNGNNLSKFVQDNVNSNEIISSSARKTQNPSNITPLHYSVLNRKPKNQIQSEKNENILVPLSPITKVNSNDTEKSNSSITKSTNRRRTLFTPNQLVELNRSNTKTEIRDQLCNAITTSPNNIKSPSLQNKSITSTPTSLTSTPLAKNLLNIESSITLIETEIFPPITPTSECDITPPLPSTSHSIQHQINYDKSLTTSMGSLKKRRTIFDEYNRTKAFSSTRKPQTNDPQRTMYDISMEIIEQRIENINRLATERKNRSVSESDINLNNTITELTTNQSGVCRDNGFGDLNKLNNQKSTPHLPTTTTSLENNLSKKNDQNLPLAAQMANKNYSNKKRSSHSPEIIVKGAIVSAAASASETKDSNDAEPPKRRKLFPPNPMIFTLAANIDKINSPPPSSSSSTSSTAVKKTDLDSNSKKTVDGDGSTGSKVTKSYEKMITSKMIQSNIRRRTTMEFQSPKQQSQITNTQRLQQQQQQQKRPPKTPPSLASTNMHKSQINIIKEVIEQLGKFEYDDQITNRTTHLISYEPLRTIKLLQGIIRGVWIVNFNWILDSRKSGKWLLEEPYEERNFSRAISMCRTERQSFGPTYRLDLFNDIGGKFYVSSKCKCSQLSELILSSGGRITNNKKIAKYIICDKWKRGGQETDDKEKHDDNEFIANGDVDTKVEILENNQVNKITTTVITPCRIQYTWILDSICEAKIKNLHDYILRKE